MSSRFLRADWHRACRLTRPQRSVGGSALALGREPLSSASTTNSGGPTIASPGRTSSSGKQLPGQSYITLAGNYGGRTGSLERVGNSAGGRFGSMNSVISGLRCDSRSCWREGWRGGLLCASHEGRQLDGRRFLSSQRGNPSGQTGTKTNRSITAEKVLLVLDTKDGSKEHMLVSRQQALDAAEATNLDLVQVSRESEPVVCRLMDFKKEEYRKQKLKKAGTRRIQKKKEIHLKGMIANHDFERKFKDVKKYLEKGDIVKVVMEANTSLLSRSGNCLNELQDNFETRMEEIEGVVMRSVGGNSYTRREIECIPKAVKAAKAAKAFKAAKPSVAGAPAVNEGKSSLPSPSSSSSLGDASAVDAAGEEKPKPVPSPPTHEVDVDIEDVVRGILNGTITPKRLEGEGERDDAASPVRDSDDSEESSPEYCSSSSSTDEWEEAFSDGEVLDGSAPPGPWGQDVDQEAKAKAKPLELGGVVIPIEDVEDYEDIAEEAAKADAIEMEWERHHARKQEDRRRKQEASERNTDRYARRGGGAGRKKWRAGAKDGVGGGHESWVEEHDYGDDYGTRRRTRVSGVGRGGQGQGQGGGPAPTRVSATVAAAAAGDRSSNFAGMRQGGGSSGGGRGGGSRGKDSAPSPAPSVRTTPYKWRTSIADADGGVKAGAAVAVAAQQRAPRGGGGARNAVEADAGSRSWATPRGEGGGGTAGSDAEAEMKGFRARFGGGVTGGSQQPAEPPVVEGPADSAAPAEA